MQKKHDPKTHSLFKIELYNKFAFPVTTVVLVLLGVPLAITPPEYDITEDSYSVFLLFSCIIF